ncbi:biotin transporter BioY [Georgenia sp. AZ-5]|uniref:biotin transporter BioY n=1 Tax=Georgenia sp. AZ-5 TaxID=3367526 RepID=UPI0037540795
MSVTASSLSRPVLGDLLAASRVRDVATARVRDAALVVGGAATVALVGQVAIPLPFTPVPLTLGTFAVLLVGSALGPVRALASLTLFLLAAVTGVPVLAGWESGWALASFGYALGYLPVAVLAGWLARRGADRSVWRTALGTLAAAAVVYAVGVPWLMEFTGMTFTQALALGVAPFLVGDAIKAVAAATLLPATWRLLGERG